MAASGSEMQNINDADLIKILVATDNHLGYNEKDSMTRNDSFITFEEILQHAVQNDVDFILLGGDLFHDSVPSQNTMQRCLQLLRTYTLGDKPIAIEFLSDQSRNFYDSLCKTVNYEDPNMNIAYPVFSIHGNHDDPCGIGGLSSLDLLSTAGVINYFGKCVDLTKINISPILIKKGETQLALYGLSHIHDNRLVRLFNDSKITLEKPSDDNGDWFNLLVLHQNRADRGPKNFLPEDVLPGFLDLVIWGHEHDCRILPEENIKKGFFVSQPGSSVATSLADGESIQKNVGLLMIHKKQFKLESIPLKTVRPFIFQSINLLDYTDELDFDDGDVSTKVQKLAVDTLDEMLQKVTEKFTDHPNQPKEPLLRLRILYTEEEQMFNAIRMGQQYSERIANPIDLIKLNRYKPRIKHDIKPIDELAMNGAVKTEMRKTSARVEDVVDRYFTEIDPNSRLDILSGKSLAELSRRLVDFNDDDAAKSIIEFHKNKAMDYLNDKMCNEDDVHDELINLRDNKSDEIYQELLKMLEERGANDKLRQTIIDLDVVSVSDNDDDGVTESTTNFTKKQPEVKVTGRGRGRGRNSETAARRGTTRGAARGSSSTATRGKTIASTNKKQVGIDSFIKSQNISISKTPTPATRSSARNQKSAFSNYITYSDSD